MLCGLFKTIGYQKIVVERKKGNLIQFYEWKKSIEWYETWKNTDVLCGPVNAMMIIHLFIYVSYVHLPTMRNKFQHYNLFSLIQNEQKATEFCHILKEIRHIAILFRPVFIVFLLSKSRLCDMFEKKIIVNTFGEMWYKKNVINANFIRFSVSLNS